MERISSINSVINDLVWGVPMLILIISTGIWMTVRTGFFQIIRAKYVGNETFFAIFKKKHVTKTEDKKAISQFQALTTALAATIGTGNIAGVATAITLGGPGAIFWMWISAFFGMMTNYSENVLGIYYRRKNEKGEWSGGAMYYLKEGLGSKSYSTKAMEQTANLSKVNNCGMQENKNVRGMKKAADILAVMFAVFCVLASFGIGNMTQVNSIADAMKTNFHVPVLATGIVLAVIAALVIVGGIKRIGSVTEKLVPFMALAYIMGALIIFFTNYRQIPYVFSSIFSDAFNVSAVGGGAGGYVIKRAVTMGFKRGVFSNEAGLGSSVMVHSASDVKEPVVQGMWGIFEVFFDTIIVCTLTAFVLLSSSVDAPSQKEILNNITTQSQYFNIAGHIKEGKTVPLIDKEYNAVVIKTDAAGKAKLYTELPENHTDHTEETTVSGTMEEGTQSYCQKDGYIVINAYGNTYYAQAVKPEEMTEEDYVYTNLMLIKGNPAKNSQGKPQKDQAGNFILESVTVTPVNGVSLVSQAFSRQFGALAGKMLAVAILLFAFSTVLGWSFYGTKAMEYLWGTKSTLIYKLLFVCFIVVGATLNLRLAWDIADTLNGLMAIPNLIAVLGLSGLVVKITKNYAARKFDRTGEKEHTPRPMLSAFEDIQEEHEKMITDFSDGK